MAELTDVDKAMLTLEDTRFTRAGKKEGAIWDQFDMSPTLFWQRVDYLITLPEALAWNAQLVRRLVRIREGRKRQRSAKRLGFAL